MSVQLHHMKENEAKFIASIYAALNSTAVVSLTLLLALVLILIFAQR